MFPLLIALNLTYSGASTSLRRTQPTRKLSEAVHEASTAHRGEVVRSGKSRDRAPSVIASRLRNARFGAIRLRSIFEALLDGVPTIVNIFLLVAGAYRGRRAP